MRRFRKATIKDVARQAGVSTTTVSVFVSGREDVCSQETGERIRTAIRALNYTPSSLTGGLRRRATATVGVCMLSPLDAHVLYGSTFFEQLWQGISYQADIENYSLLHFPASVRDGESCDPFLDGRVDGMLFQAHDHTRSARVAEAGMPTVLLTCSLNIPEGCGAVYAEESQTAELALSHLWDLGHRRIAHVAGPVGAEAAALKDIPDDIAIRRMDAYTDWMQKRGVLDPALIGHAGSWRVKEIPEIVAQWHALPEPPTGIFCANDDMAAAVIAAAQSIGWNVPEELSVVGVDNSNIARDTVPALTSVDVPILEIGKEAFRTLLRLMQGAPLEDCRVALPVTDIAVRASTAILIR